MQNQSAILNRLNKEFDGLWSFRIIEHQFRDSEIIVLGELSAGDVTRQQFGKTKIATDGNTGETSSLGDDLNKAAMDALVNCANTLNSGEAKQPEAENAGSTEKASPTKSPSNGNGSKKLTNRQLAAIFGFGKSQGLGQSDVINLTRERFGKEPMELCRADASQIIGEFTNNNGKE
jgi:hypothetical protein